MMDVGCWMLDVGCWMLDVGWQWMVGWKGGSQGQQAGVSCSGSSRSYGRSNHRHVKTGFVGRSYHEHDDNI
jgi:hypothetical protein